MRKNLFRVIGVVIGTIILMFFFTKLLMPTWYDWNTDNTVKGIYKEPENRIQVLFLGTSAYANGMSPITLYNNYGICAYNLGTPEQPLLSSYYLLQEVERLHRKTLNTIVLDAYFIFPQEPIFESNERALTYLKLSPVKAAAFKELSEVYEDVNYWNYLIPISAYHSRWMQLNEDDFESITEEKNFYFTRGQNAAFNMAYWGSDLSSLDTPHYDITDESNYPIEEYQKLWSDNDRYYFQKIVEFCRENHLNLILAAPYYSSYWDLQHDAIRYYTDIYQIPFLDFNLPELQEAIGLNYAFDYVNPDHPNILGAEKISNYIGKFITENYDVKDIRGNSDYDYLDAQADSYNAEFGSAAKIMTSSDLDDYLMLINNNRFTSIISVKGDADAGLSEKSRKIISEIGFKNLSEIYEGLSYIGIMSKGVIFADKAAEDLSEIIIADGKIDRNGDFGIPSFQHRTEDDGRFSVVRKENTFTAVSAGRSAGNYAYISINGVEFSENKDGLNIVVYDNRLKSIITSSNFNCAESSCTRTDFDIPEYQKLLEDAKLLSAGSKSDNKK